MADSETRLCGVCAMPLSWHRITRHPVGWVALCAEGLLSDITDQERLRMVAEGGVE